MHDLADTIVAVSSATGGVRSIVRLTGPQTIPTCEQLFQPAPGSEIRNPQSTIRNRTLVSGVVHVTPSLSVDARLYLFFAPHSYTGEPLAEIHIDAGRVVVEALVQRLLSLGLRPAGPGEFTARAYLNGKLDLAQAEAVNEIIHSSNRLQLDAAQKLLGGRLTEAAERIRGDLLDCLSLIEAGLDFSGEDIRFISTEHAVQRLTNVHAALEQLLAGSVRYEMLVDLPAVGIAGAPNAGKSSLLNALLGWERSIVSSEARTTRDVLSGLLTTDRLQCVLFDCAGLLPAISPQSRIDELAQQAAIEALRTCHTVLFCVDVSKPDWAEDVAARALIAPKDVIYIAAKSDLVPGNEQPARLNALAQAFNTEFLPVSAKLPRGLDSLLSAIESSLVGWGSPHRSTSPDFPDDTAGTALLLARHKQAITDAMDNVREATDEVSHGNDEVAVTMLRTAIEALSQIERQHIDEQILDRIFSRFCIGK